MDGKPCIYRRRTGGFEVDGVAVVDELPATPIVVGSLVDDMASFGTIQRGRCSHQNTRREDTRFIINHNFKVFLSARVRCWPTCYKNINVSKKIKVAS